MAKCIQLRRLKEGELNPYPLTKKGVLYCHLFQNRQNVFFFFEKNRSTLVRRGLFFKSVDNFEVALKTTKRANFKMLFQ